jgi:hypothetical protein
MAIGRFFRARNLAALGAAAAFACTTMAAQAGAPLKGIDVKLGKNPGGGCVARSSTCTAGHNESVTGADGSVHFGILPKGEYNVTVSGVGGSTAQVTIGGAAAPTQACWNFATERTFDPAAPTARAATSNSIIFVADGIHDVTVTIVGTGTLVGAAKVKSHSNTNNNRMTSTSC